MHDRRSGYDQNFPFRFARCFKLARDFANERAFRSLRRNVRIQKLKNIAARCRPLPRGYAHALVSNHDFHPFANIGKSHGARDFLLPIEHDCTVQHRRADFELSAADTHEGLLIRCHVKIGRKNSVARRRRKLGVPFFGDFSAMLPQAQDQIIERFTRFRRHFNSRETLVGTLLSDFNLRDLEIRAPGQNLIEHLRQN